MPRGNQVRLWGRGSTKGVRAQGVMKSLTTSASARDVSRVMLFLFVPLSRAVHNLATFI